MLQLLQLFKTNLRLLALKTTPEEFDQFDLKNLYFGLVITWIVGIGRWWDDPTASIYQILGLGSLIYVFVFAGIIWGLVYPLKPRRGSYVHVLTFVSMTALPAALYAIPVERFTSMDTAINLNIGFLAVVAFWRVVLLLFYLRRFAGLRSSYVPIVGLLPLAAIVSILTALNLDKPVFDIMGGLTRSPHLVQYEFLLFLAGLSVLLIGPLLFCYGLIVYLERHTKRVTPKPEHETI